MRKIAKKLLALLLASVMTFGLLPVSEIADIDLGGLFSVKAEAATVSSYSNGDIIEFGWYPQLQVTDSSLITALNADDGEWISYGYYSGTGTLQDGNMTAGDYMRYKDVIYGSNKYRGVVFDTYRPIRTGYISTNSTDMAEQYTNGYTTSTVYWFKYEPIEWRVLDPDTGMVMSETILDSQAYNNYILSSNITGTSDDDACWGDSSKTYYSNNYANSSIRTWLNEDFYNTAFSSAQQSIIQYTRLDNSAYDSIYSEYDSQTTNDKIYLLSWDDMFRTEYGFSPDCGEDDTKRIAQESDYAKCQGLHVNKYSENSTWYLRTAGHRSMYTCCVASGGSVHTNTSTNYTLYGIRPALNFNLSSEIFQSDVKNTGIYTLNYNANGGSGAPAAQTKQYDVNLTLSTTVPTKKYTVSYNANGGNVSPTSKTVSCTFENWNTAQNGSGTAYKPGATYSANQDLMLYAQWTNPTYGTLPTPARTGYTFSGWYTSATGGTKITSSNTVSSNTTLYAQWKAKDIYNLGEETYSFANFGDNDSAGGHCFGMSITSSGYYIGALDVSEIGLSSADELYTVTLTEEVKEPICHYQAIQGSDRQNAIVAGGKPFRTPYFDMESDWTEVVNYVKNHNHDNKGTLQVLNYVDGEGGHAMNFLYYSNVSGQDRIYVYDNNYPNTETYFYKDSYGEIRQYPESTFKNALDSIGLLDVKKYLQSAEDFDFTHVIYAYEGEVSIDGAEGYPMFGETGDRIKYMYEVPENLNEVKIIPLVDNAEFSYLNEEYSFGKVDDTTVGVFKLATLNSDADTQAPGLTIENENKSIWDIILDFFKMLLGLIMLPFSFLF